MALPHNTTTQTLPTGQSPMEFSKITSVKQLAETPCLNTLPSLYTFTSNPNEQVISDQEVSLPVIDYYCLVSGTHGQRSKAIQDLDKACQDWGFFILVNHGVPESVMGGIIDACAEFFHLKEEDKMKYDCKQIWDPIRFGTSVDGALEKVYTWRDFLKVFVHPKFYSPCKPAGFSDILSDYSKRVLEITKKLLGGISESLGLENNYINKAMAMESCFQLFAANLYPPCPEPDRAMGIPPHTDHGLLTLLTQNGISGLQVLHDGKWVTVNGITNSFLVIVADNLEIWSNGKFKSAQHRAVLNNKDMRISIAVAHGPSLDTVVSPALEILDKEGEEAVFKGVKYKDYFESQHSLKLNESRLDRARIRPVQS